MILDSKFEQLVRQNFLRSSREYDLARYFWANSERAMQQKPTQQAVLTDKNLTEEKRTYVTDELAKYFAGFSWTIPQWVQDRESEAIEYTELMKQHCFTRSELQSMQANNRKLIKVIQEDLDYDYNFLFNFLQAKQTLKDTDVLNVQGKEYFDAYYDNYVERIRELKNRISSTKLKLKKLVALQTKVKRLLSK